ncbi:hypothetical protein MUN88_01065 [Gracilibacillus caseinilyticus]|uniref:SdpI/YhfL protein family protein n=1 Tax=Gracilibacillus caseinilyticus TaxID=2932256 RepID=A0ABY4EYR7_9BACI|nr:hypothetical protein [Gracilibacillus caseinilyticus]UOQ48779.1 hypothetical protein MUN88_01065 [Gracilibacillus caseinilyticus]
MGIFFKKMSEIESKNWEKGCMVGFYTFLIALFANQLYFFIFKSYLFSNFAIFLIGLVAAFAWSFILNVKAAKGRARVIA